MILASRSLIVTGDDFGFSSGVNRAILEAHEKGVLTSASLMVTGAAFEEAVALARTHPGLAVGLHLVATCGQAVLSPSRIPHLVDRKGRFLSSPVRAGLRYQFSRQARHELGLEIRAQLERFQQTGLPLSHVDGHLHMHMHPVILRVLIELADEFGIKAIRLPSEELRIAIRLDRSGLLGKVVLSWIFGWLRRFGERQLKGRGIRFADRVYGLLQSGQVTEEYLLGLIPRIRSKEVEIYLHPAISTELEALLSQRVYKALVLNGFELTRHNANRCVEC